MSDQEYEKIKTEFIEFADNIVGMCDRSYFIYTKERLLKIIETVESDSSLPNNFQWKLLNDLYADISSLRQYSILPPSSNYLKSLFNSSVTKSIDELTSWFSDPNNHVNGDTILISEMLDCDYNLKLDDLEEGMGRFLKYRDFDPFTADMQKLALDSMEVYRSIFDGNYILHYNLIVNYLSSVSNASKSRRKEIKNLAEEILCVRQTYDFPDMKKSDFRCVRNAIAHPKYKIEEDKITFRITDEQDNFISSLELKLTEFIMWPVFMMLKNTAILIFFAIPVLVTSSESLKKL